MTASTYFMRSAAMTETWKFCYFISFTSKLDIHPSYRPHCKKISKKFTINSFVLWYLLIISYTIFEKSKYDDSILKKYWHLIVVTILSRIYLEKYIKLVVQKCKRSNTQTVIQVIFMTYIVLRSCGKNK